MTDQIGGRDELDIHGTSAASARGQWRSDSHPENATRAPIVEARATPNVFAPTRPRRRHVFGTQGDDAAGTHSNLGGQFTCDTQRRPAAEGDPGGQVNSANQQISADGIATATEAIASTTPVACPPPRARRHSVADTQRSFAAGAPHSDLGDQQMDDLHALLVAERDPAGLSKSAPQSMGADGIAKIAEATPSMSPIAAPPPRARRQFANDAHEHHAAGDTHSDLGDQLMSDLHTLLVAEGDPEGHLDADTQPSVADGIAAIAEAIEPPHPNGDVPRRARRRPTSVTHPKDVAGAPHLDDQPLDGTQSLAVVEGDPAGHLDADTQSLHADGIAEIREQWRRRQAWHRAEKSLTLQAKAICRRLVGGDKGEAEELYEAMTGKSTHSLTDIAAAACGPLLIGRDHIESARKPVEKRLAQLAATLPVQAFVAETLGFGLGSLAAIVGEAGDVGSYRTVSCLWKRFGLAVMPDSTRQRRVKGDEAIDHGYSASRRSVMWNVGVAVIRSQSATVGPYRQLYDERKAYERPRVESDGHAHNRAKRYVEKRLLRELWRAWRGETGAMSIPIKETSRPAPDPSDG